MTTVEKEKNVSEHTETKTIKKAKAVTDKDMKTEKIGADHVAKKIVKKNIEISKHNHKVPKSALISRGGRKSSTATAFLWENDNKEEYFIVNTKDVKQYFSNIKKLLNKIYKPFKVIGQNSNNYKIMVKVIGGGSTGQASAVAHSIAVALSRLDITYKSLLREAGLLTRDSRAVQSKNTGLRKSRKLEQFSKR